MELLVPGFFVLLFAVVTVFAIVPRLGPTLTLIACGIALSVGMYHHYKLFYHEYRLATWSDKLKTYGPGVLIAIMVLFLLGFIFTLFGGPSVPVPDMTTSYESEGESAPSFFGSNEPESVVNTVTNTVSEGVNAAKSAVGEGISALTNVASRSANAVKNALRRNNIPPSFFEQV
jgi:predicted PurR-regulated permease PerM